MLEIKDQHKYNSLQYELPKELVRKFFYLFISGLLTWAWLSDIQYLIETELGLAHLFVAMFVALFIALFVAIIKVLRIDRKLHILASNQELRWVFYDNDKVIEDVNLHKKDIKDIKVSFRTSSGRFVYSSYTFNMKDGSTKYLTDGFSFSFGTETSYKIRDFLCMAGFGEK